MSVSELLWLARTTLNGPLICVISLIVDFFFWRLQKKSVGVSHTERKDDTQISDSRKTKSNDLDISLRQNASRLFSRVKNERDRQEERGKTKIELFWGETDIWFPGDMPWIFLAGFTNKFFFFFLIAIEVTAFEIIQLLFITVYLNQRWATVLGQLFSFLEKAVCPYMHEYSMCMCVFAGGERAAVGSLSQPLPPNSPLASLPLTSHLPCGLPPAACRQALANRTLPPSFSPPPPFLLSPSLSPR